MNNPIVILKLKNKEILKIDLWQLTLIYAPNEIMKDWNSLRLFLDDKEVGR